MMILHQITQGQSTEQVDLRSDIKQAFNDIGCFLMPCPGEKVIKDEFFSGKLEGKYLRQVSEANIYS